MAACAGCGAISATGAHFCANCGSALAPGELRGESRKTVTVMFMDAVESTALGERADPESVRHVMTRYFEEIRAIVERHGGSVEKYIGDAVMAVFGVPAVHEDDALRAVRAANAIRDRLAVVNREIGSERNITVTWRTGINTGEVIAGDAASGQRFVTGDAVNTAARLQQFASPGDILLGESTYALVRDAVTVEAIAPVAAKGKGEPLKPFRMLSVVRDETARGHQLRSPMIGRERPSRLLADAFAEVVDGRVCVLFTVLGEAGVGKSRLVNEFLQGIPGEAHALEGRCLSYGEGITYWPIAEIVRQAAHILADDSAPEIRRKLGALADDERDRRHVVDGLGELVRAGVSSAGRDETFWAVRRMVESLARTAPVVLVIDDLHWAEPTLLDLVDHLSTWLTDIPVLLLCLARPELLEARPGWGGGKAHATTVTLQPLTGAESTDLVARLLGGAALDANVTERIRVAAEGNPLFVEETVHWLVDAGQLVRRDGRWTYEGDISAIPVPPTIQALLAARIDGLAEHERRVLECAAIEGQAFHRAAVDELVAAEWRPDLTDALASLARKDLVRTTSASARNATHETYRFTHLLIRDAAYARIPKERRAELHARFAAWLKADSGERPAEFDELVGYHYQQAYSCRTALGLPDEQTRQLGAHGASHLGAAGRRAYDHGDIPAARKLLSAAADLLPEDDLEWYRLKTELAIASAESGDLVAASQLSLDVAGRAGAAGNGHALAYAQLARLDIQTRTSEISVDEAVQLSAQIMERLDQYGDERGVEQAVVQLAQAEFALGHADRARQLLVERIGTHTEPRFPMHLTWLSVVLANGPIPIVDALKVIDRILATHPSRRTEAAFLGVRGYLLALTGRIDEARDHVQRCVAIERDLGRSMSAYAYEGLLGGAVEVIAGDNLAAVSRMTEAHAALSKFGERGYSSSIAAALAMAQTALGNLEEGERYLRVTQETSAPGDALNEIGIAIVNARLHLAREEIAGAAEPAAKAIELADRTDFFESRMLARMCQADVLRAAGRHEAATEWLKQAREVADSKGATLYVEQIDALLDELAASPTAPA